MVQLSRRCACNIPAGFEGEQSRWRGGSSVWWWLIFAAVVNGLIAVPYGNYTMLLVGVLQGSLTHCAEVSSLRVPFLHAGGRPCPAKAGWRGG